MCVCHSVCFDLLEKIVLFGTSGENKVADLALHAQQQRSEVVVELPKATVDAK